MDKKYGTFLFSSSTFEKDFKELFIDNSYKKNNKKNVNIPDYFDGTVTWNKLIYEIPVNIKFLSCWIIASLYVFSARLSIYTNGKYKYRFSPSKMIFNNVKINSIDDAINYKDPIDFHTENTQKKVYVNSKGSLLDSWQYLYSIGVSEISCIKDDLEKINNIYSPNQLYGNDFDLCPNSNDILISHRIGGYYYVPGSKSKNKNIEIGSEFNIRKDIYKNGPVTSAFKVFRDFLLWDRNGIYIWDGISLESDDTVGHSIVIIGWGSEKDIPYWIVLDNWSKSTFKFLRGSNHCEIEENVITAFPQLPGFRLFSEFPILFNPKDLVLKTLWGVKDNGYKLTTYERNIKQNKNLEEGKFLYSPQFWVDFSKLVAGDLSTINFNIKENNVIEKFSSDNKCKSVNNINYNCNLVIVFLIFVIIIIITNKYKK